MTGQYTSYFFRCFNRIFRIAVQQMHGQPAARARHVPKSLSRPHLPDFDSPPVTEVALSVQFASLPLFRSVHVGLYWREIRNEYPVVSEQAPIAPAFETFGVAPVPVPSFRVQTTLVPPMTRHWFETTNGEHLVQLQHDRILHNWRKRSPEMEYPRYESLCAKFTDELGKLATLFRQEGLGEIRPNQCEVTYINTITLTGGETPHEHLAQITPLWTGDLSEPSPGSPEITTIQTRFVLRKDHTPFGRVYVTFTPAFRAIDHKPVVQLEITARGKPDQESIAAAFSLLDEERDVVVRTFASVTTRLMHKEWGRTDAA
jgi:uncharacterized protein (TIGR04255 family)